ncbi:MAG TPA: lactate utilization protein [Candidatus Paceibacterota bacterium]|nr:lactate utilization protein [Candidatus Paceibacterota bacterium]
MDYTTLASKDAVEKTVAALTANNFMPEVVPTKEAALARIKELIPAGSSVMNGASRTLEQIGYVDYLKEGSHGWQNLHAAILEETDASKKTELRKAGILSDFYLGSVHALTQTGEMVIASNTGSQLPHLAFTSPNLLLIVSTQKITPTLTDAMDRLNKQVIPLEDERMKQAYGYGTLHAKTLILHKENPALGRKVHVLLVEEKLGF